MMRCATQASSIQKGKADLAAMAEDIEKIVSAAQNIFRQQWERVKKLE
jgi:hypothetical protein